MKVFLTQVLKSNFSHEFFQFIVIFKQWGCSANNIPGLGDLRLF